MKLKRLILTSALGIVSAFSLGQCPTISVSGTPVNCYGDANGSATVTVTGGTGTYSIDWDNGGTTSQITGLIANSYSVTVNDIGSGCSKSAVYVVNSPDPINTTHTSTDVNCFSNSTGTIDLSVVGGSLPYTYDWSNDGTTDFDDLEDINGLAAGSYDVVVNDNNNCKAFRTVVINQPNQALASSTIKTDVSCFGGTDGTIDLTVYGGTAPYMFSWSNGANSEDLSNLAASPYNVTITDNKGCIIADGDVINQPTQLTSATSTTSVICYGDPTGSIAVNVGGGTPPYSYQWQNSSFIFAIDNASLNNVEADSYQVTATDAKGCTVTDTDVIGTPTEMISSITGTNVSCFSGNDGTVDVSIAGGTPGYTYSWTNSAGAIGFTTQDLNGIPAESYAVVITDNNGCTNNESFVITEPVSGVDIPGIVTAVDCYGTNTGSIDISPVGGTEPYNYNWSNGTNMEDAVNLVSGNYLITIIDANSCSYSAPFTVTQPADTLIAGNIITNVSCFEFSDGIINTNPTGGTAPYIFNWENSDFQLSDHSEDLLDYPADIYNYELIDANNCIYRDTFEITEPTLLENSLVGTNILCKNDATGAIDQTITGGTTPYSILWSNGALSEDITNLTDGWYTVTVTDNQNCVVIDSIEITEPQDTLGFTFTTEDVTCNDGDDGRIDLIATGGTPSYTYSWTTGDVTPSILDITAGWYYFLITDQNGCTIGDSVEIFQPEPLVLNEVVEDVSCFGLSDGDIDISPVGGTAPYSYTWYNSTFQLAAQDQDIIDFPADIYQLELRDTFNCLTEVFIELPEPELLTNNFGSVNVTCAGGFDGSIDLEVMGGNPGYTYSWSNGATTQDLTGVPLGTYDVQITDTKNCKDSSTIIIYEPDSIKIDFETVSVSCQDQFDGEAGAYPYGGTGDFTFLWNTGDETHKIEILETGYYSVTVMDVVGCTTTDSAFVSINLIDCIDPPNTITPNNDQYNDVWNLVNIELYPEAVIQIYNKWGNIVSEQSGGYTPWNGEVNGLPVPADVYYYIINLNSESQAPLKGTLTVIR